MSALNSKRLTALSMVSTISDALVAFARGRRKRGLVLLGAAAATWKLRGLGVLASILVRLVGRIRSSDGPPSNER